MKTLRFLASFAIATFLSTASFAQMPGGMPPMPMQPPGGQMQMGAQMQMGPQGQFLPGPGGQVPMMQPQGPMMAYQPTMVGEQPPVPTGCGMGRNDYTRIVNQGGVPMPMMGGSHN